MPASSVAPRLPPGLVQTYADFLGVDPTQLAELTPEWVEDRNHQLVRPLAQIAANQGFPENWRSVTNASDAQESAGEGGGQAVGLLGSSHRGVKG